MKSLTIEVSIFQLIIVSLRRNVEYYSALKKKIPLHGIIRMDLGDVVLSEEAQKEKLFDSACVRFREESD